MNRFTQRKVLSLLFGFFMMLLPDIQAQPVQLEWASQMGAFGTGAGSAEGTAIAVDKAGNVYTTGFFNGTADFDPGPGVYNLTANGFAARNIYVSKLDASGNFVWAKQFSCPSTANFSYSIAVDDSGNVYTTGQFNGTADFDPGPGVYNVTSITIDVFISKLDSSGNFVWAKSIGGKGSDIGNDIAVDNNGYVYLTGLYLDTVDFDPGPGIHKLSSAGSQDVFVLKLTGNGNFVWAKSMGGTGQDEGSSIAIDAEGNIITAGTRGLSGDFDPGPGVYTLASANGGRFISKLDNSGNFIWAKSFDADAAYYSPVVAVDDWNNVYLTGYFTATRDFDPGPGIYNLTALSTYEAFIVKLTQEGAFQWARQMGGTPSYYSTVIPGSGKLGIDKSGNVYIAGTIFKTTGSPSATDSFRIGHCVFNNFEITGRSDIFICKFDNSGDNLGNFLWIEKWGEAGVHNNIRKSVTIDEHGYIYVVGGFRGAIDFDPGPDTVMLTTSTIQDAFVLKLSESETLHHQLYGPDSVCPGQEYTYSVAPSSDSGYIWHLPAGWTGSSDTNSITVTTGEEGGQIAVEIVGIVGCGAARIWVSLDVYASFIIPSITVDSFTLGTASNDYDSWQWLLGGHPISGAIDSTYTAVENGEYSVIVTKGDCIDTAHYTVTNVPDEVSIEQYSIDKLVSLYPNPNSGRLFIKLSQSFTDGVIRMINVTGQTVMEAKALKGNQFMFDISAQPPGIYFVELEENRNAIRLKLVKE